MALLGSKTGKLVAAVGQSGLSKGSGGEHNQGSSQALGGGAAAGPSWPRAAGRIQRGWRKPWPRGRRRSGLGPDFLRY